MKRILLFSLLFIAINFANAQFITYPRVQDSTVKFLKNYPVNTVVVNSQNNRCYMLMQDVHSSDNLQNSLKRLVPCYNPYDRKPDIITGSTQPIIPDNSYGYWRKVPDGKLYLIINKNGNQFIYEQ